MVAWLWQELSKQVGPLGPLMGTQLHSLSSISMSESAPVTNEPVVNENRTKVRREVHLRGVTAYQPMYHILFVTESSGSVQHKRGVIF